MSARVVIIVESCFGNTAAIAQALAEGLDTPDVTAEVIAVQDAGTRIDADLILLGAPTHNLGLSSAATRAKAAKLGAPGLRCGVREWIEGLETVEGRIITFATITGRFSGSAAVAAAKRLRRQGVKVERGPDFRVNGTEGPLAEGELARATAWARQLDVDR